MPRKYSAKQVQDYVCDFSEEEVKPLEVSKPKPNSAKTGKRKTPKQVEHTEEESSDECEEEDDPVNAMLQQFGSELKKSINAKRRKMETFAQQCKESIAKMNSVVEGQKSDRDKLFEEFDKHITGVMTQMEADISKSKENEEKINSLFNQQLKLLSQVKTVQHQRYKSTKQLHEQYAKSVSEVEKTHVTQRKYVTDDLDKEMAAVQKKLLADSRKQELSQLRKTLRMLYQ